MRSGNRSSEANKKHQANSRLSKKSDGWRILSFWATEEAAAITKTIAKHLKTGSDLLSARKIADNLLLSFPSRPITIREVTLKSSPDGDRRVRYARDYLENRAKIGEYRFSIYILEPWRELLKAIIRELREKSGVAPHFKSPHFEKQAEKLQYDATIRALKAQGLTRREIAEKLNISPRTVSRRWN